MLKPDGNNFLIDVTQSAEEHIIEYDASKHPTHVVGAFGESPAGLLSYSTYTLLGFPNGKEYYQTREQAIDRGESLVFIGLVPSYSHGLNPKGFHLSFRVDW